MGQQQADLLADRLDVLARVIELPGGGVEDGVGEVGAREVCSVKVDPPAGLRLLPIGVAQIGIPEVAIADLGQTEVGIIRLIKA